MPAKPSVPEDPLLDPWSKQVPDTDLTAVIISVQLTRMVQIFEQEGDELARPLGFSFGELDVLFSLLNAGKPYERRPRDLVRSCLVTGGAITGRVDRLIKLDLVNRHHSLRDRREIVVNLTPAGLKIARSLRTKLATSSKLTRALGSVEPSRRLELLRAVQQLYGLLQQ